MSAAQRTKRARSALLLLPVLLAFVGGCTVGPNFHRPKTTVSAGWQESGDPRVSTASATYRDWWKAFNDPILDRLIERAYRENLSLRQAGVRVLQARALAQRRPTDVIHHSDHGCQYTEGRTSVSA